MTPPVLSPLLLYFLYFQDDFIIYFFEKRSYIWIPNICICGTLSGEEFFRSAVALGRAGCLLWLKVSKPRPLPPLTHGSFPWFFLFFFSFSLSLLLSSVFLHFSVHFKSFLGEWLFPFFIIYCLNSFFLPRMSHSWNHAVCN